MATKNIYIEASCLEHPRAQRFMNQYPNANVITCQHYQTVFNPIGTQDFRIQKSNPAYILAKKQGKRVHPTPESFGIGGQHNFYFSHLLNCPYDCRYCFLQGMYPSAHYVWFLNYEDYMADIKAICKNHKACYFFSGYDADSLALNAQTEFLESFVPFFQTLPNATMELRTKSANVNALLKMSASEHTVCAFSMSPELIVNTLEHRTARLSQRLTAIKKCADHGWPIGLRFDPVIYYHGFERDYAALIQAIFQLIDPSSVHSISVGPLRFPKSYFKKIKNMYPEEPLFSQYFEQNGSTITYPEDVEQALTQAVIKPLQDCGIEQQQIFRCYV